MNRVAVAAGLVSSVLAARVKHQREGDEAEGPVVTDCPTDSNTNPCPAGLHYCRVNGGCFEPMSEDKGKKTCGTPLCALPGKGGHRHEEVVHDEKAIEGCPASKIDSVCPSNLHFCRSGGGCYTRAQANGCKVDLCPLVGGGSEPGATTTAKTGGTTTTTPKDIPYNPAGRWEPPAASGDLLQPVDTKAPPGDVFPPNSGHYMPPQRISAAGKHQTNKFWTNWISGKGNAGQKPVYSMPYSLRWSDADDGWKCHYYSSGQDNAWCKKRPTEGNKEYNFFGPDGTCGHCDCCSRTLEVKAELSISHLKAPYYKMNSDTSARRGRIAYYISRFSASYSMGVKEKTSSQHFQITKEELLGVEVEVKASGGNVKFPVYRGMPYISGRFDGLTPRIDSPQGLIRKFQKVERGVFEFVNDEGAPDKLWQCHYYEEGQTDSWCKEGHSIKKEEFKFFGDAEKSPCGACDCCKRPIGAGNKDYGTTYQAYVLDYNGNFIDGDFKNSSNGFLFNQKLHGWVRMAHIIESKDAAVYQKHAPSILQSVSLSVQTSGEFSYKFARSGNKGVEHLHWGWRHQKMLMKNRNEIPEIQITHIMAPTKGKMVPLLGTEWKLKIDITRAQGLNLLPNVVPTGDLRREVEAELDSELRKIGQCSGNWNTQECEGPRTWIFTAGFYTNGKGLQKLGTLCLMSQKLFGSKDARTTACANLFKVAFRCHYDASSGCGGVPKAFYDAKWGGIASRQGFDNKMCGLADFGNACYNDHHYHYGYFIHAGAIMLQVMPEMRNENDFIAYINSMIRDIANPSTQDKFFPQFRAFDWYDLHSWSHGVTPSADGKDEESTSEDVNAYFGMQMWARLVKHKNLEKTAAILLSLLSHSASNLFLMKDDNQVHPKAYIKNRVTGIFFEGKVHYGTFFGSDECYIHGIQMIPLTPALRLARSKEFTILEYNDILSKKPLPIPGKSSWSSLLITGNLAFHQPDNAFSKLKTLPSFDKGLSKAWAMYWTASIAAER